MQVITVLLAASFAAQALADLQTVTSSGRDRTYWVHEPDDFKNGQTYPAIIAFHGSSGIGYNIDGFAMEADIRLSLPVIPTAYSSDVSQPFHNPVCVGDETEILMFLAILYLPQRRRRLLGWPFIRQSLCSRRPAIRS